MEAVDICPMKTSSAFRIWVRWMHFLLTILAKNPTKNKQMN